MSYLVGPRKRGKTGIVILRTCLFVVYILQVSAGLVAAEDKTILFFGDSLTAGYQVEPEDSFPGRIEAKLRAEGLPYTTVNAGVSGDTTSSGLRRLAWVLRGKVDIFVLELGANDGLRGLPLEMTRENLQRMIDAVRTKQPQAQIVLVGMQIPPNLGSEYVRDFRNIFVDLAQKNQLPLVPFLLEGVAGNAELNLPDGIHPTAKGYERVAENVWKVLEPLLK